jgi:hypothetical protein
MLIEIIPEVYDLAGKAIPEPYYHRKRKKIFHPTFPIKRFLTHSLKVKCTDIDDIADSG